LGAQGKLKMNAKTNITDQVLFLYGRGWPHDAISSRLRVSKVRVDKIVDNMERGMDMNNRPTRQRKVPSKSYDKLPIGEQIVVCKEVLTIALRTSCKDCVVNSDHKFSKLCTAKCDKDTRFDGNDVMYVKVGK
jgi:hypothetical protein